MVLRHAPALEVLDMDLRAELGDAYSEEAWNAHSFALDRPNKWRLSRLAFQDDLLCAFWIASLGNGEAHTHRVGVDRRCRRLGIISAVADEVHDEARRLGARRMTLFVSPENAVARRAYERLGYRACEFHGRPAMERLLCE